MHPQLADLVKIAREEHAASGRDPARFIVRSSRASTSAGSTPPGVERLILLDGPPFDVGAIRRAGRALQGRASRATPRTDVMGSVGSKGVGMIGRMRSLAVILIVLVTGRSPVSLAAPPDPKAEVSETGIPGSDPGPRPLTFHGFGVVSQDEDGALIVQG
jgi:hypothetical protein